MQGGGGEGRGEEVKEEEVGREEISWREGQKLFNSPEGKPIMNNES